MVELQNFSKYVPPPRGTKNCINITYCTVSCQGAIQSRSHHQVAG